LGENVKELVHEEMKTFFRPEFLNRLDETIVFRPLNKENVRDIAEVEFRGVLGRLVTSGLHVSLSQEFKDHVVEKGYDPAYGARPLRRAITNLLEDKLAEYMLSQAATGEEAGDKVAQRSVLVDLAEGKVTVTDLNQANKVMVPAPC
jgi:ATP-dependent Clp protease ATP-binding subunit ClpC